MATFDINLAQLQMFFLVFVRLSAIMMNIPVLGGKNIPFLLKAGTAMAISIILYPVLVSQEIPFYYEPIPFAIGICSEIFLGIMIGLSVSLIFAGIQLAGQLVGYQMGFAIANVMDPQTGSQASIVSILLNIRYS